MTMTRTYSRTPENSVDDDVLIRERTNTVRESVHVNRDASVMRTDAHPVQKNNATLNSTYLDAPTPRPGFVQRWISDGSVDSSDVRHWMKKMRDGWSPRSIDTIPVAERKLYQTSRSDSGVDMIRVSGLVLCEQAINIARTRKSAVDSEITRQLRSIPGGAEDLSRRWEGRSGPIMAKSQEVSARGRQSATMVD